MDKSFDISITISIIIIIIIIRVQSWFLIVTNEVNSPFSGLVFIFLAVTQFKQTWRSWLVIRGGVFPTS